MTAPDVKKASPYPFPYVVTEAMSLEGLHAAIEELKKDVRWDSEPWQQWAMYWTRKKSRERRRWVESSHGIRGRLECMKELGS